MGNVFSLKRDPLDSEDDTFSGEVTVLQSPPVSGKLSAALFFSNFQVGGIGQ